MKKWKSLFACGLVLLLTGWTMLCIPFNAYAQTWEAESTSTNIVAVVDCSTSMQSSDSDWKIPESLDMLVDMCDDEQVRLSLIVYGTSAETAFRDFPLSAENHEMVKKQIHQALMVRGYNLGQTDTDAALGLAQQILEQQAGQNNMVLLFTDGAIRATRNGRTNEISEQEVDAFAAFAQNNGVVVNTLGLFNKQADAADVETAEEELSILRSKTGGMYQRVDDPADIPDFVIQLLAGLLDVKTLDLSSPTETTVDGKHAWQYDFSISDQYIKDLTVVWPAPVSVIQDILISGPATDGTAVSLNNWTDGEWVSTTRYNAKPGYQVIRIDTDGQKKGDYSVFFVTNEATPVAAEGFYLYDVNLNVEIGAQDIGVMQSLPIEVYLTDSQGYRIDDVDFLQTLAVELEIVNQQNMGVEVEESAKASDIVSEQDSYTRELKLYNDSFRLDFVPERATDYRLVLHVSNAYFSRTSTTRQLTVHDQLDVVSSVVTATPRKNRPVEVRAYLIQQDNHDKVVGEEFYRLSGMYVEFTNQSTGAVQTVEMQAVPDGNGMTASYTPTDEGEYTTVVRMKSHRENVTRSGEKLGFSIQDRPITKQFGVKDHESSGLMEGLFKHYWAGSIIELAGDTFFYDPDGDSYRLEADLTRGEGEYTLFDNIFSYTASGKQTMEVTLTARDYSGNAAVTTIQIRVLSIVEVILLTVLLVLLVVFAIAALVWVIRWCITRSRKLKGVVRMDVSLNGERLEEAFKKQLDELQIGRFYIPLENPKVESLADDERLRPRTDLIHGTFLDEKISFNRMLYACAQSYRASRGGEDGIYQYLKSCGTAPDKTSGIVGQKKGMRFGIRNVSNEPSMEKAFVEDRKRNDRESCVVYIPADSVANERLATKLGTPIGGIKVVLRYCPAKEQPQPKVRKTKKTKSASAEPEEKEAALNVE